MFGDAFEMSRPAETTPPRIVRAAGTPEPGKTNTAASEAERLRIVSTVYRGASLA